MKKFLLILAAALALCSCGLRSEDWEKEFSGTWDLTGIATLNWNTIEKMSNFKLAKYIDDNVTPDINDMTLVFGQGRISFESDGESVYGRYTVDNDGTVQVSWEDDSGDVYWMYVEGRTLYMVEFGVDDNGDLESYQTALKFQRISQ